VTDNTDSGSGAKAEGLRGEEHPFDETLRFLHVMRPDGRCVLSAICPETERIEVRTFELDPPDPVRAWLGKWNGKRNLYWTPNRVKADAGRNWKPSEADVEWLDLLHVDIDPPKNINPTDNEEAWAAERARIRAALEGFAPKPSAIVDSGNGYQAFWLLVPEDRLFLDGHPDAIAEAKLYNIALRDKLGGDNCQSLEHLMRLPGTRNLPNEKKRKAGRGERIAAVVKWPEE